MTDIKMPLGSTARSGQRYILDKLNEAIDQDYKNIIISAPTGIGKSYIAKALANALGSAFIITSTKHLQDQYIRDFNDLVTIKGKSNFACKQLQDKFKIDDDIAAMEAGYNCEMGNCSGKDDKGNLQVCEYKLPDVSDEFRCHYYLQKDIGLFNRQTVLNYAMFFQMKRYQADLDGLRRDALIFDEAHTLESEVVMFIGADIGYRTFVNCGMNIMDYDKIRDIEGVLEMLLEMRNKYAETLQKMEDISTKSDVLKIKRLSRKYESLVMLRKNIAEKPDNFILQDPEYDDNDVRKKISVVPLDVTDYLTDLLQADYRIFMSATIDQNNFSKIIGMDNACFIDVPESPFLKENRSLNWCNIARLNFKSPEADEIKVGRMVDAILDNHADHKGLILSSSVLRCENLLERLSEKNKSRVQLAHSNNKSGKTLEEIFDDHAKSDNGILLSASLWHGVDLKDDLSRFQIIEKCPYLNLGDKRVKAMMERDQRWYTYQTIVKLLQGFGRSIRNEQDWAKTYIIDTNVQMLLRRSRGMVPRSYHDIIYGG